jgi:hypothetical protein
MTTDISVTSARAQPHDAEPADGSRRALVLAVVLVVLVLAPVLVLVALRVGYHYTPASDIGTIDLRVREVFSSRPPLVGPYGNHGWDHPGPLLFYLLAVPSLLSGRAAWGTQVGGALLWGIAIVWLAVLAWRRGGLALLAVAMVGMALLANSLEANVLRDPWNPHLALPWFAVFLFQAWLLATGDGARLPGAVFVGTFLVQTHIGYLPLVVAAGIVVVACRVVDLRSARPAKSWRRPFGWALVVGGVLWLPPVLDALKDWPGNLGDIASYFLHPEQSFQPQLGLGSGARLFAAEFAPFPDWLGGHADFSFLGMADGRSLVFLVIPATLLVLGMVVAHRRDDAAALRFLVLVSALAVAGCFALSRVEGSTIPYLFLWRTAIAIAIVLGVGWALLAGTDVARRAAAVVGPVLAVVVVVWGSGQYAVKVADAASSDTALEQATASLSRQLERHSIPKGGVILRLQWESLTQVQRGVFDELARQDANVHVDQELDYQYRDGRAASPDSVARVWWVADSGAALTDLMSRPGAKLIASWSSLSPRDERRARELSSRLRSQFHELGRADLDPQLDTAFIALVTDEIDGVDHAAARELAELNVKAGERGGTRTGVVEFAPADAPSGLGLG